MNLCFLLPVMRSKWRGRNPGLAWFQNSLLSMFNFHGNLDWCLAYPFMWVLNIKQQARNRSNMIANWLEIYRRLYPFHLLKITCVTYILVTSGPSLQRSAPWRHLSLCKLQTASWPFTRASLSNYRPGIAPKRPTCVRLLWKHFLFDGLNILTTSSSLQLSPVAKWCVVLASNLGLKLA